MRMLLSFGLSALLLAPVAWWWARRLARPIHAFANAAERLGRDPQAPPLTADGPSEVRTAVGAFNDMQEKLRRYVAERTAMVAAMAHDLRAPLMRLRFRVEGAPEDIRSRAAADIEQMDAMISAALAYARGEGAHTPHERLDFSALASSVVDDAAETGAKVSIEEAGRLVVDGDALSLRRLVSNLVDNAVKFAGAADVKLSEQEGWAVLTIEDHGPGLPAQELERVFEPFYRPDASRNPTTGGFGLGLGAARTIARTHGGDVTLENRPDGGLRATVRLPLASG
jgi:signal transduction histidine kinase